MHSIDWITTVSYGAGALAFLVLAGVLFIANRRKHPLGAFLLWASLATVLWSSVLALWPLYPEIPLPAISTAEAIADSAWLLLLARLVSYKAAISWRYLSMGAALLAPLAWVITTIFPLHGVWFEPSTTNPTTAQNILIPGGLILAILGLVMLEQIWRNVIAEDRWSLKYLCIGIGAQLAYNLLLYSEGMLYHETDAILWATRGAVFALTVPLLMIAFFRNTQWPNRLLISRRIAFHSTTLIGAGFYLLVVAGGGYYIRDFGGSWGRFWATIFVAAAAILLISFLVSEQIRARTRVFLVKNFFAYKYDYRDEWNRLTNHLYRDYGVEALPYDRIIQSAAGIVDSLGGALWARQGARSTYRLVASINLEVPDQSVATFDSGFADFIAAHNWIIDADDYPAEGSNHPVVKLPDWLQLMRNWWLVVPLVLKPDLVGILILARSRAPRSLTWEDWDLLKTVGQQLAAYLSQYEANQSLSQARQFQAVHQLSIFLMHDLKNLIAQQSLLLSNADKHKDNPAFVEDMIATIEDSVQRMTRTLAQLQGRDSANLDRSVMIADLLKEAVGNCQDRDPKPCFELANGNVDTNPKVLCDRHALINVVIHMIRNAQDATPHTGIIRVVLTVSKHRITISVIDNGIGMTAQFIRERLFKPFDTTKSARGMGIGAYQAQSFARQYGGDVEVESIPGHGTRFDLWLPRHEDPSQIASEVSA